MKIKETEKDIKRDWPQLDKFPTKENLELRQMVEIIDKLSQLMGCGEITITSYYRPDPHSLHGYGQAVDIRVKDKSSAWYFGMNLFGLALSLWNPRFRINPHLNLFREPHQHIHLEIRNEK